MSEITFKVSRSVSSRSSKEFRRFAIPTQKCTIKDLRDRVSSLFQLSEDLPWSFRWVDEDGDLITLSEQDELDEAIRSTVASGAPVVRLEIFETTNKRQRDSSSEQKRQQQQAPDLGAVAHELFTSIAGLIHPQQQQHSHHSYQHQHQCQEQQQHQHQHQHQQQHHQASPSPPSSPLHVRGLCDITDERLHPGSGNWFHVPNTTYDLCRTEWERLSEDNRSRFVEVKTPEDLGKDLPSYRPRCSRFRRCPPRTRHLHTHLAWCDSTNIPLFLGHGWYHMRGANYDLCEAAFHKLSQEEKTKYTRIVTVEDLGQDAPRYATSNLIPRGLQTMFDAFVEVADGSCPQPPECRPKKEEQQPQQPEDASMQGSSFESALLERLAKLSVVSTPTVVIPGAQLPGTTLTASWDIANPNATAVWRNLRLIARDPNPFAVPASGIALSDIAPNSSTQVTVAVTLPESIPAGVASGLFDVVDEHGNAIVGPLQLDLQVAPTPLPQPQPQPQPVDEQETACSPDDAVKVLIEMGFGETVANAAFAETGSVQDAISLILSGRF